MSSYEEKNVPQVPPAAAMQAPPAHATVMPSIAAGAGVRVDIVDSGAGQEFARPTGEAPGPLANALEGRLTGSSAEVDAVGEIVSSAADPTVDARVNGGAA